MAPVELARRPPLSDVIEIRGLRALGRHGADPGERDAPQPFDVDIALDVDLSRAGRTDDLAETIDYARVADLIRRILEGTSFQLLERLGEVILSAIFEDKRVIAAEIAIAKPGKLDGATPVVRLRRRNG